MTGRHVLRRQRRSRCRRGVPSCVLGVVVVSAGMLGFPVGPGVAAAFTSHTTATTGTLSFAQLTASFATGTNDLGGAGGTGGSSYTMSVSSLLQGTSTHRYTTLTNTGSVTETITGSFSESAVSGAMTVAVDACSIAWSAGLCTGTTTSLLAARDVSTAPSLTYAPSSNYGSLAVNGVLNLRYTFTATSLLGASATVVASAVPTGTGTGNRTAG